MKDIDESNDKMTLALEKQVANINKRFMEKVDIKKTFKTMERQLKNLFDIIVSKMEEENNDEAMGTKKPVGAVSCISCQKGITNL